MLPLRQRKHNLKVNFTGVFNPPAQINFVSPLFPPKAQKIGKIKEKSSKVKSSFQPLSLLFSVFSSA